MSKIIDVSADGGDLVILGRALVLPSSNTDGAQQPTNGSLRFNPSTGKAEFYYSGAWTELGSGSGGGGGSTGPITISNVTGLQSALDSKAALSHNHSMGSVDGLIPALDAKANKTHTHTKASIVDLQPDLDSLQSQITGKAAVTHGHAVADVTGLQGILDGKAATSHSHGTEDITGLDDTILDLQNEKYSVSLPVSPPTNFTFVWTVVRRTTFFGDFAGAAGTVLNPPAAQYTITITKGGNPFGTISIATNGTYTFETQDNLNQTVEVGESLVFTCPAQDGSLINPSFTLIGKYTG